MKVRTYIIFMCMTVVPALALFSHQLPAGIREAARARVWEPVQAWATSLTRSEAASVPAAAVVEPPIEPRTKSPAEPVGLAAEEPAPPPPVTIKSEPRSATAEALAALGAVAIDTRPFDAVAGTHVASCRVPVDTAGQLHRVFQAAGRDPEEAMTALLATVKAWKERQAGGATGPRR